MDWRGNFWGDTIAYLDGGQPVSKELHQLRQQKPDHTKDSLADLAREYCDRAGILCSTAAAWDESERRRALARLCSMAGVEMPHARHGFEPLARRLTDPKWWARKLWTVERRRQEAARVAAGDVRRGRAIYCSDQAVKQWRDQRAANLEHMQTVFAFNDDREVKCLAEIAQHSLANPAVRRAEMFARLRGLEEYATECGHRAVFVTLTCPSRMHPSSDKYDGTTPKQAQEYLCQVWARARASLARETRMRPQVDTYGFAIAEPHHDGCPHWHLLLFCAPHLTHVLCGVIRGHALEMDGLEAGATKRRVTFEHIDPAKGSAVGYVAKYISKAIDGQKVNGESIGTAADNHSPTLADDSRALGDAIDTAERVIAWASTWGIRQFRQIGGERVGPYRELRRLHNIITASAVLEQARDAARSGQWCAYMKAARECGAAVAKTFEFCNRYGEPTSQVVGVVGDGLEIITRRDDWRMLTEAAIHDAYQAADDAEAAEFWGDIIEAVNVLKLERSPPGRSALDPFQ